VSLEGSAALHEFLRVGSTYGLVVQGVERVLSAGLNLSIFTTACRSLLPELPRFAEDLFKNYPDIDHLTLIQLVPVKNGSFELSGELLDPQDLLKLVHMVGALNLLGYRTRFLNNPLANVASRLLKVIWVSNSTPLYTEGSIIVMANRDIRLSHSSRHVFGKYASGMIQSVLASEDYLRKVSPDQRTCPSCRHAVLCMKHKMERPTESYWDTQSDTHYCQALLDSIQPRGHNKLRDFRVLPIPCPAKLVSREKRR